MRVSYINSICARHDAISNAIHSEVSLLQRTYGAEVRLFAYRCDYPNLPYKQASDASVVAMDPHFQNSDLIIFHFGVFYPLFNLISLIPREVPRVVVFHNVTPKKFLPHSAHSTIDRSLGQISMMAWADEVICDSDENLRVLRKHGIKTPATVVPIAVPSATGAPSIKPSVEDKVIRFAFVGRFVQSKGIADLIAAFSDIAEAHPETCMLLDMLGNLDFSDPALVQNVRNFARRIHERYGERVTVEVHGSAPDAVKLKLLTDADVFVLPTYHEGFCVPIIEALGKACRVIAYDNSNVPSVCGGQGHLVETGSVGALARALNQECERVSSLVWRGTGAGSYREYRERVLAYCRNYLPEAVDNAFLGTIDRILFRAASHSA